MKTASKFFLVWLHTFWNRLGRAGASAKGITSEETASFVTSSVAPGIDLTLGWSRAPTGETQIKSSRNPLN
ncbi:MAG: hypothetical protein ISS18_12395 [Bacteroidales bacterium]|nr:hypothetical protein [Bacteroidales bacterium]